MTKFPNRDILLDLIRRTKLAAKEADNSHYRRMKKLILSPDDINGSRLHLYQSTECIPMETNRTITNSKNDLFVC